jgi:hypothetical protein
LMVVADCAPVPVPVPADVDRGVLDGVLSPPED